MKNQVIQIPVSVEVVDNFNDLNISKGILSLDIPESSSDTFKNNIVSILTAIKKEQLEIMAPMIKTFIEMQSIYGTFYDPENKESSVEQYEYFSKNLISPTKVKDFFEPIYRPVAERKDEIVAMRKLFEEEAKNVKSVLAENFKEYLDEKNAKAIEAKKRKEEREAAAAKEMQDKLAEANEKAEKAEYEKNILKVKDKINGISTSVNSSVNVVNTQGLYQMLASVEAITFPSIIGEEKVKEIDMKELLDLFNNVVGGAVKVIQTKVKEIEATTQNEQLISQTPQALEQTVAPTFNPTPSEVPKADTDLDRIMNFDRVVREYSFRVKTLNVEYMELMNQLINEIEDPNVKIYLNKLPNESALKINQWMDSSIPWIETLVNAYKNYNNK